MAGDVLNALARPLLGRVLFQEHGRRASLLTDLQDFSRRLFAAADQLWTNSAQRPDQYAQPFDADR